MVSPQLNSRAYERGLEKSRLDLSHQPGQGALPPGIHLNASALSGFMELDDGKIDRKPLYFMVKTMVSGVDFPNKTNPLIVLSILKKIEFVSWEG